MTDRELLELAAKAAGFAVRPMEINNVEFQGDFRFIGLMTDSGQWKRGWFNPLEDDGDALRLAVSLKLYVQVNEASVIVDTWQSDIGETKQAIVYFDQLDSPEAATRRAIVRAAAEIGKEMK